MLGMRLAWKLHAQLGKLPRLAADGNRSAVAQRGVLHDSKPKPGAAVCAAVCAVCLIKTLKNARLMLRRDANAVVAHTQRAACRVL